MAVLMVIVMMFFTISNMTVMSVHRHSNTMDASQVARTVFNKLDQDLSLRLGHFGLGAEFVKADGNDGFAFFSQTPDRNGVRRTSWVQYALEDNTHLYRMSRASDSLSSYYRYASTPDPLTPAPEELPLAQRVIRIEFYFITEDGMAIGVPAAPEDMRAMEAVRVGLVVAEERSLPLLTDAHLVEIRGALSDLNPANVLLEGFDSFQKVWEQEIIGMTASSSLPLPAVQGLRVFERTYTLKGESR